MSTTKALSAGLLAGLVAGIAMTVVMLLLACFGVATPLSIIGDRLSVFIKPGPFLAIMGRVGGYNHLKQLGVGSTMFGQLLFGAIGGSIYGFLMRPRPGTMGKFSSGRAEAESPSAETQNPEADLAIRDSRIAKRTTLVTMSIFVLLPIVAVAIVLWPVLGTNYRGMPAAAARLTTLIGFALSVLVCERALVFGFQFLTRAGPPVGPARPLARSTIESAGEFTPPIGRRALILSGLGLLVAGGGAGLMRKLYRAATFSYDGTQYKGRVVQPITPNDLFYCVTKNVVDPRVNVDLWHLEVNGLVQNPTTYRFEHLKDMPAVEQETTLMCISNGLDAGLMSNAVWKGFPMRDLIDPAVALVEATRVRLHGVDNYTDTIPLEKAMEATTLLALQMNGVPLPHRHGYPLRAIVPGYFGEKHVKWLTRIELATADAKGFYEAQGWGPDFITPTRSRIDVPDHNAEISLSKLKGAVEVKGVAFGGDRGISRVEVSFDDGETWDDADIYYAGGDLAWSLWNAHEGWMPDEPGDYTLVVRATDGEGNVQEWEEDRSPFSGATGFHRITVYVT